MSRLSDSIESFIVALFDEDSNYVDIRRNELAAFFNCVPSQINYVLSTRFTLDRGYVVESHRGGGGYIRIAKMKMDDDYILDLLTSKIGDAVSERSALHILEALFEEEIVSGEQKTIMDAAVGNSAIPLPNDLRDKVRAQILKQIILAVIHNS